MMTGMERGGEVAEGKHACTSCGPHGAPRPGCVWCHGTGYETEYQDVPVCPHCGAEQSTDDLHDHHIIDCDACGKQMDVEVDYSVSYTTRRRPGQVT